MRSCELRRCSGISFAKRRWCMAVLLSKTRSAREMELKANGTNIHPWKTRPALPCSLHPNSFTLISLHAFRVMHWICTQNCINPLRTEHFCPSPWLQPLVWVMEPGLTLLQVHLQYFLPDSELGKTFNNHVQSVYGPFVPPSRHRDVNPSLWSLPDGHQARHHPAESTALTVNPVRPRTCWQSRKGFKPGFGARPGLIPIPTQPPSQRRWEASPRGSTTDLQIKPEVVGAMRASCSQLLLGTELSPGHWASSHSSLGDQGWTGSWWSAPSTTSLRQF